MSIIKLIEKNIPYDQRVFEKWKNGNHDMLNKHIPPHVTTFLINKAKKRKIANQESRLFSEAMALNYFIPSVKNNVIWYNSFKWLSASKWVTCIVSKKIERQFCRDIHAYLKFEKKTGIEFMQSKARDLKEKAGAELLGKTKSGKIKNPTAPDIWFINKDDKLVFVEAKREEALESTQLAGIALIKKYLCADVLVVRFYPKANVAPEPIDHTNKFNQFYKLA